MSERSPEVVGERSGRLPEGHLTLKDLRRAMPNNDSELRERFGITQLEILDGALLDKYGRPFFVPLRCEYAERSEVKYLIIDFVDNKTVYKFHDTDVVVCEFEMPPQQLETFLIENSRATKVVKSRPGFMYPELFQLPAEEVWPKEADIAVIGDPDAAIDRERVTIVEYEYADEIFPPALQERLTGEHAFSDADYFDSWYLQLFREDLEALNRMYGGFTPDDNPYWLASRVAMSRLGDLYQLVSTGGVSKDIENGLRVDIEELRGVLQSLADGTWDLQAFTDPDSLVRMEDTDDLRTFFVYKQKSLEGLGNPDNWQEFIQRWTSYLDNLPHERLRTLLENYDEKLSQVRHWLQTLPTATSPDRATRGLNYLENFYDQVCQYPTPGVSVYQDPVFSPAISDALSKGMTSDGAFGFFVPGHPISLRTRKFLKKLGGQLRNMVDYVDHVLPLLDQERERILAQGIPATSGAMFAWLRPLEQQLIRERYFVKPTEKATTIHGFFPYDVNLDPQDRIVALTSVTMHGWNALDRQGFTSDIEAALPFLKVGGKYILGPINQRVYFGSLDEGFDAQGLTRALSDLRDQGRISFYFVKGKKERPREDYDDYYRGADSDDAFLESPNDQLLTGESAHSLVIERLS